MVQVRLKVNSVDLTANLLSPPDGDWEVERSAFGAMAVFGFTIHDPTNAITLAGGQEVLLENFSDSTDRYFGGTLTEATGVTWGLGRRFTCKALGWVFDLERTVVNQIYLGKSDQFVITDATTGIFLGLNASVLKDLSAYTVITANVEEGLASTQKLVINGDSVKAVMDMLAAWSGNVWGVEPDQTVYYREYKSLANSNGLSDSPDNAATFPYYGFSRFQNFSEIVNAVYVYGGRFTNASQTRTYESNGTQTSFIVPHDWRAEDTATDFLVVVEKWNGSSWDVQTVGTPEETGSFDVIWHELGRSFIFTTAPGNYTEGWRVTGNIYDSLYWEEFDEDSIADNGQYEITIRDATLRDQDAVERRALIELLKRNSEGERLTLRTQTDGFREGRTVTITNTVHGLAAAVYLVDRVIMRPAGDGSVMEYELSLKNIPSA